MTKYYLRLHIREKDKPKGLNVDIEGEIEGALNIGLKGLEKITLAPVPEPKPQPKKKNPSQNEQKEHVYDMIAQGKTNEQIQEIYPNLTEPTIGAYRAHYTRRQKQEK